jgi:hypothetical protein
MGTGFHKLDAEHEPGSAVASSDGQWDNPGRQPTTLEYMVRLHQGTELSFLPTAPSV